MLGIGFLSGLVTYYPAVSTFVEQVCPHCGAPLNLDKLGACRWCHAQIRVNRAEAPAFPELQDQVSLVPAGTDPIPTAASLLRGFLQMFEGVGKSDTVAEYMRREPRLLQQVRALTAAVSAAGVRLRDAGLEESARTSLAVYTPEEIWTFDLAFDVMAQLCAVAAQDRPLGQRWADMAGKVQNTHQGYASKGGWQQGMREAGGGPVTWHELRVWTRREVPVIHLQDGEETDECGTPLSLFQDGWYLLVPEGTDDCFMAAAFLFLALSTFSLAGQQPPVKECMRREPRLLQQVRALTAALSAAGVRVRDAGLVKDGFDGNLAVFAPDEIWTFDLAIDVLAQFAALDGLTGEMRASIAQSVQQLDRDSRQKIWQKGMKKAGGGPVAWHELRARTRHRG